VRRLAAAFSAQELAPAHPAFAPSHLRRRSAASRFAQKRVRDMNVTLRAISNPL